MNKPTPAGLRLQPELNELRHRNRRVHRIRSKSWLN